MTVKAVILLPAHFYAFPPLFSFLIPKRSRSLYARGVMERQEKRCGWQITAFTAITVRESQKRKQGNERANTVWTTTKEGYPPCP